MSTHKLTVAVTGATGFVGQSVITALQKRDYNIRVLVRNPSRLTDGNNIVPIQGSLTQPASLIELVSGADAVLHLVGIIMEKPSAGQTFDAVHVHGTQAVLAAAKAGGVKRWVQMSALGTRPNAISNYHRTKWLAEEAVRHSGLKWTIIRPSLIHGPRGEFMQMVRDFWVKRMPPFVPYFGSGLFGCGAQSKIQPVYVEDVAEVFVESLTREKTIEETYGLGGPDEFTWPELYRTIQKHLPAARKKRILAVPAWKAKLMARTPLLSSLLPFNWDQVVMSQEDSTCNLAKLRADFAIDPAPFEATLAGYASSLSK